jgi:nitroimidazol reductase NimA-like FMN-containing flavoprotein (pyridoxamine 5'-phosphate oxidase superfamily)
VVTAGLEDLSDQECERLLASQDLGRVAIVLDGRPQIFPVNYAFADGVVVFRTGEGLKLDRSPMTAVAFETDGIGETEGLAWSVMVQGTAQNITNTIDTRSERLRHLSVSPAAPGDRPYWVGIYVTHISGRRFKLGRTARPN